MNPFNPLSLSCPKCGNKPVVDTVYDPFLKSFAKDWFIDIDDFTKRFDIKLVDHVETERGILHHNSLLEPDEPIEELVTESITQYRIRVLCKICGFSQLFETADHTTKINSDDLLRG